MKYVALAEGLRNRKLILASENIFDHMDNPNKDYYVSLYKYDDIHFKRFKETRSLGGIKDVKTDKLLFDFDSETDVELAKKDALVTVYRLTQNGLPKDNIGIYFSGKKGFCVEVNTESELTRQEFTNIVFNLAGDLPTFDTKINDEQRIIRAPLTKHQDSGLYKIPLTVDQLSNLSVDEIREIAKAPTSGEELIDQWQEKVELPGKILVLKNRDVVEKKPEVTEDELSFDTHQLNLSQCPKWMPQERYALQEGFFYGSENTSVGERNHAFMILAATYKYHGFNKDIAFNMLKATAELQAKRTGESIYEDDKLEREIINVVYSPTWTGGVYATDDSLLVKTRERFNIKSQEEVTTNLISIKDVYGRFEFFAKNIDKNTIKTGLKEIDENILMTTGMCVGLLGSPGSGKTTFANGFVEEVSMSGEHVIYNSLDMTEPLLYSRMLQKHAGYSMKTIMQFIKDGNLPKRMLEGLDIISERYKNVEFNFKSGSTIEDMDRNIVEYEDRTGHKVKLVVVDYLEKIVGPYPDATANSGYVGAKLADIARERNCMVLVLLQPQKMAGDPSNPLLSMRKIKGSSRLEQDMRCILTMWRPGFNPQDSSDDNYASIAVVKNNMGSLGQFDFGWDGERGLFMPLDEIGKKECKELAQRKERERREEL